jgi:ABC-type thiamin/hydroxymethylpyrimidine transport system permease subunit
LLFVSIFHGCVYTSFKYVTKVATVLNRQAYDEDLAQGLWDISEKATGISKKDM